MERGSSSGLSRCAAQAAGGAVASFKLARLRAQCRASGGGVRGGMSYGVTDDYGYYAAEDKVHLHDLHATILHLLGLDHLKLTYRYAGRDFRLTDIHGEVVHRIMA